MIFLSDKLDYSCIYFYIFEVQNTMFPCYNHRNSSLNQNEDGQITIDHHLGNIWPITSGPHYIQRIGYSRESVKEEIWKTSGVMIITKDLLIMCKSCVASLDILRAICGFWSCRYLLWKWLTWIISAFWKWIIDDKMIASHRNLWLSGLFAPKFT